MISSRETTHPMRKQYADMRKPGVGPQSRRHHLFGKPVSNPPITWGALKAFITQVQVQALFWASVRVSLCLMPVTSNSHLQAIYSANPNDTRYTFICISQYQIHLNYFLAIKLKRQYLTRTWNFSLHTVFQQLHQEIIHINATKVDIITLFDMTGFFKG